MKRNFIKTLIDYNNKTLMPRGYKANKWIFRIAICFVALFLIFVALSLPKDKAYFKCIDDSRGFCENPFYNIVPCPFVDAQLCMDKTVRVGVVYGSMPNVWFSVAFPISFGIMALAIIINHFLYNKDFKFE